MEVKLYNRNYESLVAISKLLKIYPRISKWNNGEQRILNNTIMVSTNDFVSAKECKIMNDLLFLLPNFIYTFDLRNDFNVREYINGPTLKDLPEKEDRLMAEIFIQLSFVYDELLRQNDMIKITAYPTDKFSFDKKGNINDLILYKRPDMKYCVETENARYNIDPNFVVVMSDLNIGDLSYILPISMRKTYKNIFSPILNMLELVKTDKEFAKIFNVLITIDQGQHICRKIFKSPDCMVEEFLKHDPKNVLEKIAKCVNVPKDYVSCKYYVKSLSALPKNLLLTSKIHEIQNATPLPTGVPQTLIEDLARPLNPGITLEYLTVDHIDSLIPITIDQPTMLNIGNGEVWDRKKLLEKAESNITDSKMDPRLRKYYHWVVLLNDKVIGYLGLHPMVKRDDLQFRIIISSKERGKNYATTAIKNLLCMENVSIPFIINGVVNPLNLASISMMKKAGMVQSQDIKIKGITYNVFVNSIPQKSFILPKDDPGFQYSTLRMHFLKKGYVEGDLKTSNGPSFIWGNPYMAYFPSYCKCINYFDGVDIITDGRKFRDAISEFFPDIQTTRSSESISLKTLRVYFYIKWQLANFISNLWNHGEFTINNEAFHIDIDLQRDNIINRQLKKILDAIYNLVRMSARLPKMVIGDCFQIFTLDMEVADDNRLSVKKITEYNNYEYKTGLLSFSDFFFEWVGKIIDVTKSVSPLKFKNFFGSYGKDYDLAKRELPFIIDYPYLKYYTSYMTLSSTFQSLKNYKYIISEEPYTFHNIRLPSQSYLKFDGKYRRIISTKIEPVGMLSDFFVEDIRVHCKFMKNPAIYDYYNQNVSVIINFLKSEGKNITIEELRESLWQSKVRQCTTFKPKLIKYIIDLFKSRRVLDMSAGWGDRLIGAMASNIELYHGFDPNLALGIRYDQIIEFFRLIAYNPFAEFKIQSIPFEDAKVENGFYDLVMSSPPYFNMEIYTDAPGQSTESVNNEEDWYKNYLWKWLQKSKKALRNGGILALNINQERDKHYVNWVIEDLDKRDSGFKYLGLIGYSNEDGKNPQPIFIWKRII